jgi:hypothetical protein
MVNGGILTIKPKAGFEMKPVRVKGSCEKSGNTFFAANLAVLGQGIADAEERGRHFPLRMDEVTDEVVYIDDLAIFIEAASRRLDELHAAVEERIRVRTGMC